MANNYLITGRWNEPHVTPENDRGIHAGIFGAGRYVLPVGEKFRAEYIGNNTIRMYDGKLMDNGAAAGIPAGEYVDILISNASQGMNRNDLIVFQYSLDSSTLIEKGEFIVVQGVETNGTASDPAVTQADLLTDKATLEQFPLWRVPVSGVAISAPVQVFELSKAIPEKADSGHSHSLSSGNITGVLPVTNGGTGATDAATARSNLGITPANIGAFPATGGNMTGDIIISDGENERFLVFNRKVGGDNYRAYMSVNRNGDLAFSLAKNGTNINYILVSETNISAFKPITVASGGTSATDAATARANLGITPANIGALPTTGGQVNGSVNIVRNDTNGAALHMKRTKDGTEADLALTIAGDLTARFSYIHGGEERNYLLLKGGSTALGKPLSVDSGGTGANSVAGARKNLGFVYSATEQATGDTWIDGKPIYRVVIETGAKTNNNQYYDLTAFNVETYITMRGMLYASENHGDGGVFPVPFAVPPDSNMFVLLEAESRTRVKIGSSGRTWASGFIVIEFTKTTD